LTGTQCTMDKEVIRESRGPDVLDQTILAALDEHSFS
jgi:hypothetical protein